MDEEPLLNDPNEISIRLVTQGKHLMPRVEMRRGTNDALIARCYLYEEGLGDILVSSFYPHLKTQFLIAARLLWREHKENQ